ncbi:MAG: CPBP family intramembrane metalloprotease [Planctomycetaceae bacterium]|nr:CPBP family intramembrane metalloprotease [Planctomycetaceae bacterium]
MSVETSSAPSSRPALGRTLRLAIKELREILRDRRTVLTLILMPLLVYPLLGVLLRKGLLSGLDPGRAIPLHICLSSEEDAQYFSGEMLRGEELLLASGEITAMPRAESSPKSPVDLSGSQEPPFDFVVYWLTDEMKDATLQQQVADSYADLSVSLSIIDSEIRRRSGRPFVKWELIQRNGSSLSERARREVVRRLTAINDRWVDRILESSGMPALRPATMSTVRVEPSDADNVSSLVTFIPLVLVLMTMTGAVYPAIDLTAGERERGTMEILVAAPISRVTLLVGKFVAVLTVALLTATMNLISMFATLFALGLEGTVLGNVSLSMMLQVLVLMVVFAAFFSAVLLSITSVARSFKEAQAYLIPLMLVSLSPGVFSLMPDIKMSGTLAVIPLVNTVLMGRDLLLGDVHLPIFAVVLISTAIYGVVALSVAARIFGADDMMTGGTGTVSDLLKRPAEPVPVAPLTVSLASLAVVFSLFVVLGSVPSRWQTSLSNQLLAAGMISVVLFVLVPAAIAGYRRVNLRTGFALRGPALRYVLSAMLLGLSLWAFVYELEISFLTEERIEFLKQLYEGFELNLNAVPLWVKLFALAIAPAVCEEFFFRGFLQNSIRQRTSAIVAVLISGFLFGLFHVIVKDALLFERLLPSTLMGIVLGIVFERSRSVFPGMLLHVLHNGLLVTVSSFEQQLSQFGIGMSEHQHLPISWLLTAALPVLIAVVLLCKRRTNLRPPGEASSPDSSGFP